MKFQMNIQMKIKKINQISNENESLNEKIQKEIQINQQTFQKEIKEIKGNLEIFNKTLIKEKLLEKVHKLILFNNMKSDIIKYEELDLIEDGIRKNLNKRIKEYNYLKVKEMDLEVKIFIQNVIIKDIL